MSIVTMNRHQKSEPDKTKLAEARFVLYMMSSQIPVKKYVNNIYRYWIRATLSLVIVMGIAWIFNILFFIEQLIFVAYIMTMFIAGQGLIIFIFFVVLSKEVSKWNFACNQALPPSFRVLL